MTGRSEVSLTERSEVISQLSRLIGQGGTKRSEVSA
jgi:hypothetical protein